MTTVVSTSTFASGNTVTGTTFTQTYTRPTTAQFAVVVVYGTSYSQFTSVTVGGVSLPRIALRYSSGNNCMSVFAGPVDAAAESGNIVFVSSYSSNKRWCAVVAWMVKETTTDVDSLTVSADQGDVGLDATTTISGETQVIVPSDGEYLFAYINETYEPVTVGGSAQSFSLLDKKITYSTRTEWAALAYALDARVAQTVHFGAASGYGVLIPILSDSHDTTKQVFPRTVAS